MDAQGPVEAKKKASDPMWPVRDFLEGVRSKMGPLGVLAFFR